MGIAIYVLVFVFFLIGLYALVAKKNVVRIIIGVVILESAVNLMLVLVGYRKNGMPPILAEGQSSSDLAARAVDPIPQAMVLTTVIVGLSFMVLAVALAIRLYDRYGTFDMNDIRNLRG